MKAFFYFDFDSMRSFLYHCPGTISQRETRVALFDLLRFTEKYENIYEMVERYGGKIIYA